MASSGLPGLMRCPPVCGMSAVGFRNRRDCSGFSRLTKSTSDRPKTSTRDKGVSTSGTCIRVADATPSGLWQFRQPAFSIIGYSVLTNVVCPAACQVNAAEASTIKIERFITLDAGCPPSSAIEPDIPTRTTLYFSGSSHANAAVCEDPHFIREQLQEQCKSISERLQAYPG